MFLARILRRRVQPPCSSTSCPIPAATSSTTASPDSLPFSPTAFKGRSGATRPRCGRPFRRERVGEAGTGRLKPRLDLPRVEADQVAPLQVRNPVLGHQSADVPLRDRQSLRQGRDIHEGGGVLEALSLSHVVVVWCQCINLQFVSMRLSAPGGPGVPAGGAHVLSPLLLARENAIRDREIAERSKISSSPPPESLAAGPAR